MLNMLKITPVILSGGLGTRLWPASRPDRPKQLIALVGRHTLLQATTLRVAEHVGFNPPLIVTGGDLGTAAAEQLSEIGVDVGHIVLEPVARGTATAAAIAALILVREDPNAIFALLPSDHAISNQDAFARAMATGADAASRGALVAFGMPPNAPETGYGYIRRGAVFAEVNDCYHLKNFVEKPDRVTAERYLISGEYLWNSGMFVISARDYLQELERLEPKILRACERALREAVHNGKFVYLDESALSVCPSQSIDRAVMERTDAAAVIPVDLGWRDIGTWASLWEVGKKDNLKNVVFGDVDLTSVCGSLIYNERNTPLFVDGIHGSVVASTDTAVFVAERARSAEIGTLVPHLYTGSQNFPITDVSFCETGGIFVVKIGCPDVKIVTAKGSVHIVGLDGSPHRTK